MVLILSFLRRTHVNYEIGHERTNITSVHNATTLYTNLNFQTKKLWSGSAFVTSSTRELDFFKSRIPLQPVRYQPRIVYGTHVTAHTRKRVYMFANINAENRIDDSEIKYDFTLRPSFRITDKFFLSYNWFWQQRKNRLSFVTIQNGRSILSRGDKRTIENSITGVYSFDTTKSINLRLRNFWSSASFSNDCQLLLTDGTTQPYNEYNNFNPNADFNTWNMDVSFDWRFALTSNLTILYRNNFSNFQDNGYLSFSNNLYQLF